MTISLGSSEFHLRKKSMDFLLIYHEEIWMKNISMLILKNMYFMLLEINKKDTIDAWVHLSGKSAQGATTW